MTRAPPQPAAVLRIQSSAQGQPRAVGWGQARIAGNLIGFWNFAAAAVQESVQGGKGGGGGGTFTTGYTYSCALAIGLAEGPIAAIIQGWSNKAPESVAELGFAIFDGGYQQSPWGWLIANHPEAAQNFRGLAYVANANLSLGSSPALPNLSFEVRFAVSGAVTESAVIPGSPYQIQAQYFDVSASAVAEEVTVPYAAPYQIQAQHPQADTVGRQHDIATASGGTLPPLPTSSSAGVFYTDTDPPQFLTRVGSSPAAGQYAVDADGLHGFNAADAGAAVTIVDLALSPGVAFATQVTGDLVKGSATVANLSSVSGIAIGDQVSGAGVAAGTRVQGISGGAATCTVSSGSAVAGVISGIYAADGGASVTDSGGLFPAGTTVTGPGGPTAILSSTAAGSARELLNATVTQAGTWGPGNGEVTLGSAAGISVGMTVTDLAGFVAPGGYFLVGSIAGTIVSITYPDGAPFPSDSLISAGDNFYFTLAADGTVHSGSSQITDLSVALPAGAAIADQLGLFAAGTTVSSASSASLVLSHAATGSSGSDVLSFPDALILSQQAAASGTGVTLAIIGAELQQCAANLGPGLYTVTPGGLYTFHSADSGKRVVITDVPDANPAEMIRDFLANPQYGVAQFPAARVGDLSTYAGYCQAAGLFVSPVLNAQGPATQLLQDVMVATNSEFVWSGGALTVVPYGDRALNANGASYAPPAQPIYSLGDSDFLPNQATNAASVAAASTHDPVTVTRLDPADQANAVQVEYLDRANSYNPAIAEAQDDAAINLLGKKPSGSRPLHLLCDRRAALHSAQLQLGRQQVRNLYSFTLDRKYILLDPMDIVAITDPGLGLAEQWVRIREITENDDRSLSIVAEEYLAGTGAAPRYGHQQGSGFAANFNADPGNALAPVFMDVPAPLVQTLGCEGWLATNGGLLWGGCEVWISSDDVSFHYAGTLQGGSVMGTLSAALASGSDPDTTHTVAADLTPSRGTLLPGTQADADNASTICFVDGEYIAYQQATLTGQYRYDLGTHGASAGYLRRGRYGSAIASHAQGANFVRLRKGTLFQLPYDKGQIGTTIHVKLLSFNIWGGGRQTLDQVASYAHTVGGAAPALSSVGALALYSDLNSGAATSSAGGQGNPGGCTAAGTGMVAAVLSTVGGTALISVNGAFGPGTGSPAATKVTLSLQRSDANGTVTIYTGTAVTLPAANNSPFSLTIADAPAAGSVAYQLIGTADQGVAPFSGTYFSVSELRR